jgi:cytochrome c oxidase assembly protein subunit 15
MVVLSAYIRLAEVGIACDGWPACYGILDPDGEKKGITVLTEQGRDMGHRGARLAHRYIASTLGIFILILFALSVRQKNAATGLLVPTALLLITIFLSVLGYYTPTRDNPLITMGNLLGGMAMLGLLWWMMQRNAERIASTAPPHLRQLVLIALILVGMQTALGGWSSANYASGACMELLACEQPWLSSANYSDAYNPARDIVLDDRGQVIRQPSLGALSMTHRIFALCTAAYLAWLVRKLRPHTDLENGTVAVSFFSISLIVAGVSMIWLDLPLALVSLHNFLAAGLLIGCLELLHQLTPQRAL